MGQRVQFVDNTEGMAKRVKVDVPNFGRFDLDLFVDWLDSMEDYFE